MVFGPNDIISLIRYGELGHWFNPTLCMSSVFTYQKKKKKEKKLWYYLVNASSCMSRKMTFSILIYFFMPDILYMCVVTSQTILQNSYLKHPCGGGLEII
jgi:hypothetical protein